MNYRYIAVEGNIGSGKTTLATNLAKHYNARLILEEFGDNPFLEKFYEDASRYAFPLELAFLADRYQQLKNVLNNQDLFQERIVSDYIFPKTKIFAKVNLEETEYNLFAKMAEFLRLELTKPDLLIYLHASVDKLQKNIQLRGRQYEQNIPDDYLSKLDAGYQLYLQQESIKVVHIDAEKYDLRKIKYLKQIADFLEEDYDFEEHTLVLK